MHNQQVEKNFDVLIDHISIDFVLELQQKQIDLIFENRAALEFFIGLA